MSFPEGFPMKINVPPEACELCGEPIKPGEKTYRTLRGDLTTGHPVHYDCKFGPDGP